MIRLRSHVHLLFAAFLIAAVLCAPLLLFAPMHHGALPCPVMMGDALLCATESAHVSHWQWALLAALTPLLLLGGAVHTVAAFVFNPRSLGLIRFRAGMRIPRRPTYLEELFAQGVLHPKPY